MKLKLIIIYFLMPFNLSSQNINCIETNEPMSLFFTKAKVDIDFNDIYGINDSLRTEIDRNNLPIPIKTFIKDTCKKYFLKLIEGNVVNINNSDCILTLLIINNTDSVVEVPTIDNKLFLIAEIKYNNKWYPIEYHLFPECGNSFYDLPLKSGMCYKVNFARYLGSKKSKLRYKLKFKNNYLISNSIDTKYNFGQIIFNKKQVCLNIIDFEN